ncbi:uncharacterized protein TNCT_515581 [Trichonephila clavata]|uniref:Gustatory receptor n=1 Tax=Trichonephila clavata TaxID=2740835 RepID=A0A8X6LWM6_TRICU|nr:uncharacterized protein TNCT_515581 [Trichonephila clavata]
MHAMFIDMYPTLHEAFTDLTKLKVAVADIASYIISVVVWYVTLLKRKRIADLLKQAEEEKSSSFEKFINYLVILSCSVPVIISIHLAINISTTEESVLYTYDYDVSNEWAIFTLISVKSIIIYMVNPTYINIVALFYISLCLRCKTRIQYLNREIEVCSPEDFTLRFQRNILRKRVKTYNFLLKIKDTFSLSIFFIMIAHIAMCSSIIGWLLVKQWDKASYYWKVETPYFAISSVLCVVSFLWVAGSIPVELSTFKETFYQKTHQRLLYFNMRDELFLKTDLFQEPEFEFSGCEMVSFRRGTILTIIGTSFTYTMLVIDNK